MTLKRGQRLREPHQRKASSKGKKSMRGQADNRYGEPKKRVGYSLTPTAHDNLNALARRVNLPASDILERLLRMDSLLESLTSTMNDSQEEELNSP